jgi:hypothetical protein
VNGIYVNIKIMLRTRTHHNVKYCSYISFLKYLATVFFTFSFDLVGYVLWSALLCLATHFADALLKTPVGLCCVTYNFGAKVNDWPVKSIGMYELITNTVF